MTGKSKHVGATHAAWYSAPIPEFLASSVEEIVGKIILSSPFDEHREQRDAWESEIALLRRASLGVAGHLFLEFDVPRLGSRIDAVVLTGAAVVPIEFKIGQEDFVPAHVDQAWDYGLDLKNFHAASHDAEIFPVLVATAAPRSGTGWDAPHHDGVRRPLCTNAVGLGPAVARARDAAKGPALDGPAWGAAPYCPTPTIVQAARALYSGHSVEAISRSDAGARNLVVTSRRVEEVIQEARAKRRKAIIFVTGVPGAGKTLVGLNVATRKRDPKDVTHAVYLSGNGPLVAVLREALTRDEVKRRRDRGQQVRKGDVGQRVKAFIQNVHHFRDDGLRDSSAPPVDRVVIFDEAQRAWNLVKTADFMKRRKKRPGFAQSEPEFLLSYMDRHDDWAAVVCLVGGGQEIHTGEAGIGAWLDAVQTKFPAWQVHVSSRLSSREYEAATQLAALQASSRLVPEPDLHLATSMRSFRAEAVSNFVGAALASEVEAARGLVRDVSSRYPLAITRDLERARAWIRQRARGTERYGLVASSQAQRLKPHAIDVRVNVDPVHWFLDERTDTRSSFYLEDAATEFQVQGLELDWVCMTWDADLRRAGRGWSHHSFRGDRWVNVLNEDRRRYLINAYRVLLTRARQGMVIFVPPGSTHDHTRQPRFYDETYAYLCGLGIPAIS